MTKILLEFKRLQTSGFLTFAQGNPVVGSTDR